MGTCIASLLVVHSWSLIRNNYQTASKESVLLSQRICTYIQVLTTSAYVYVRVYEYSSVS